MEALATLEGEKNVSMRLYSVEMWLESVDVADGGETLTSFVSPVVLHSDLGRATATRSGQVTPTVWA